VILTQAEHKVGGCHASLSAVREKPLMFVASVLASHHEAMCFGFDAGSMAIEAVVNALPHFTCQLGCMWHYWIPFVTPGPVLDLTP
jgi:hypothetical protein